MNYPFRYDYLIKSNENKPTEATNGSTLYEVDTGKFYIYYEEEWILQDFE